MGRIQAFLADKADLAPGLAGHVRMSRRSAPGWWVPARSECRGDGSGSMAGTWAVGFALVRAPARAVERAMGLHLLAILRRWSSSQPLMACAGLLLFRCRKGLGIRGSADSLFLVGWLVIELAASFVLTPFPAARRVIGISVVGMLLVARAMGLMGRIRPMRMPQRLADRPRYRGGRCRGRDRHARRLPGEILRESGRR